MKTSIGNLKIKGKEDVDPSILKKFILNIQKLNNLVHLSSKKYDKDILYYMLSKVANLEDVLASKEKIEDTMKSISTWVSSEPKLGITDFRHEIVTSPETGKFWVEVHTTRYADKIKTTFGLDNLKAPEIQELRKLWAEITTVSKLPVTIIEDNAEVEFDHYQVFYNHVMESAKKGIYIQRYKGLGEMNPEQLWDTTMNKENRSLLQVNIDDAVAADETFSILMGEMVEPRRQFIQDNALHARSLDV